MWATLAAEVFVLTRPTYSSISLGLLPADWIRVGSGMSVGMGGLSAFGIKSTTKAFIAEVAKEARSARRKAWSEIKDHARQGYATERRCGCAGRKT